jgi:hypothetical protein
MHEGLGQAAKVIKAKIDSMFSEITQPQAEYLRRNSAV